MGLGLFACRKDAWVGFNPRLWGFGAEEGYLHELVRRHGGKTIGLHALGWVHRFSRPSGIPYRITRHDRIRNYEVAWAELGWDRSEMRAHFAEHGATPSMLARALAEAEHPLGAVDAVMVVNLDSEPQRWATMQETADTLGFGWRVERLPAVPTPGKEQVSHALAFRSAVTEAQRRALRSVLILSDDAAFLPDFSTRVGPAMEKLSAGWDIAYLGPHSDGRALIVNASAFGTILSSLPTSVEAAAGWISDHRSVDSWLQREGRAGQLMVVHLEPSLTEQVGNGIRQE